MKTQKTSTTPCATSSTRSACPTSSRRNSRLLRIASLPSRSVPVRGDQSVRQQLSRAVFASGRRSRARLRRCSPLRNRHQRRIEPSVDHRGIRMLKACRFRYRHDTWMTCAANCMRTSAGSRHKLAYTDGVFSMDARTARPDEPDRACHEFGGAFTSDSGSGLADEI